MHDASPLPDDTIIVTERLLLRLQRPGDVEELVALWTDPEVTRYLGGPREITKLRKGLDLAAANPAEYRFDLWTLVERRGERFVGHCGFVKKEVEGRNEIEVIYVIESSAQGRGYATEIGRALVEHAFGSMEVARLIALIDPENEASGRVAGKIGMRLEGEIVRPGGRRNLYAIERQPLVRGSRSI